MAKNNKREYCRVSDEQKKQLIFLVFNQCLKIKEAAISLKIKYAAAKTIVILHRKQKQRLSKPIEKPKKKCGFRQAANNEQIRITIETKLNGELVYKKNQIY